MQTDQLFKFILERHNVYTRRASGIPKPWTTDPILQQYRFCNVYRELDAVTQWIRQHWGEDHGTNPDCWFAMAIARLFNQPGTLALIEPLPFKAAQLRDATNKRRKLGLTVFNAAYIVSTNGRAMDKIDYVIEFILTGAWRQRMRLRPRLDDNLASFHRRLVTCHGLGSFMAAQIVADTKFHGVLASAVDWWTWAAPGPGSLRGMSRVLGLSVKTTYKPGQWLENLNLLGVGINVLARDNRMPRISAQDLQNCLCEFDKYERVRLGEGRPKQLYPGGMEYGNR